MVDKSTAQHLIGQQLRTADGAKIGTIGQVYLDDYDDRPEWVTVNTGMFGSNESFVPLAQASIAENGLVVPYTKDQVKEAPNIDESGHLTEREEQALYEHYNIPFTTEGSTFADTRGAAGDGEVWHSGDPTPVTDDAMTRSEEQLRVGTQRVETGRARLRKWVDSEIQSVQVPIRKERVRLETEPITDANRDAALTGPDITENEYEVTLTEERPVVAKETVPVERVRVTKDVEEAVERVEGTVRKERIDVETEGRADIDR